MKATRIAAGLLVGCLLAALPLSAEAAKRKKPKPPQPIEIVADDMYFSDKTGELFAKGNVVITQEDRKIFADVVRGNNKETEVWVDGQARFTEPLTTLNGTKLRYNYGLKYGSLQDVKGKSDHDFLSARSVQFEQGMYTAYDATMTGCPAKVPDQRVTARKVVIWPGDKLIAYDAKVWIRNFVIYSTPRYTKSLKDNAEEEFPRFGHENRDGYYIAQRMNYAFTDNVSVYADLIYYSQTGFKPDFGIVDREDDFTLRLMEAKLRDSNGNWIRKEPELRFEWQKHPVGKTGWNYQFTGSYGLWNDDVKSSWHQDYNLYFSRAPIYLDKAKTWTWRLGFGGEHVRDSYDGSAETVFRYNTSLYKRLTPGLTLITGYNYTSNSNNSGIFNYNRVDVANEWINGFQIQIDKKTAFSFINSYDTLHNRTYENYFTLYRDLHCWRTFVQYRAKTKEWKWELMAIRF